MSKITLTREQKAVIILQHFVKMTNRRLRRLLEVASAYDVIKNHDKYKDLFASTKGEDKYQALLSVLEQKKYLKTFEYMEKKNIGAVIKEDKDYPIALKEIDDPPEILYYKGNIELLKERKIGVVGSRNPSPFAKRAANSFVGVLAGAGLVVVSGLAMGIDGIAHSVTLDSKGKTIAVLGCGIDLVYPACNTSIYERMTDENSLLLSEYGPGVLSQQCFFALRNRLISALSDGVLIIEAGEKSGSLITARNAIEQNRNLYVVPCDVTNTKGNGSNKLIYENLNSFVRDAYDILTDLNVNHTEKKPNTVKLDFIESIIEEALKKSNLHFDELKELTKLDVGKLMAMLTRLELAGIIKGLENNYFSI